MGIQKVAAALATAVKGNARLVLIEIAWRIPDSAQHAEVRLADICAATGLSERTVRDAGQELVRAGLLYTHNRPGLPSTKGLTIDAPPPRVTFKNAQTPANPAGVPRVFVNRTPANPAGVVDEKVDEKVETKTGENRDTLNTIFRESLEQTKTPKDSNQRNSISPAKTKKAKTAKSSKRKKPAKTEFGPAQEVLESVNAVLGTRFRGQANLGYVSARLKENFTPDDVVLVAECKKAKWGGDPQMVAYLRPSTLFSPTKFPGYLLEAQEWKRGANVGQMRRAVQQAKPDSAMKVALGAARQAFFDEHGRAPNQTEMNKIKQSLLEAQ